MVRETRGLASFLDTEVPEDALAISFRRRRQVWENLVELVRKPDPSRVLVESDTQSFGS
jgi:hypothetical protein